MRQVAPRGVGERRVGRANGAARLQRGTEPIRAAADARGEVARAEPGVQEEHTEAAQHRRRERAAGRERAVKLQHGPCLGARHREHRAPAAQHAGPLIEQRGLGRAPLAARAASCLVHQPPQQREPTAEPLLAGRGLLRRRRRALRRRPAIFQEGGAALALGGTLLALALSALGCPPLGRRDRLAGLWGRRPLRGVEVPEPARLAQINLGPVLPAGRQQRAHALLPKQRAGIQGLEVPAAARRRALLHEPAQPAEAQLGQRAALNERAAAWQQLLGLAPADVEHRPALGGASHAARPLATAHPPQQAEPTAGER